MKSMILGSLLLCSSMAFGYSRSAIGTSNVNNMSCAKAQAYVARTGHIVRYTSDGPIKVRVGSAEGCAYKRWSYFVEPTLDNSQCVLGYQCYAAR